MTVTVPSDKHFRRSRIHATRRSHLRAKPVVRVIRAVLGLCVLAAGGYVAAQAAVDMPGLRVRHIIVHGNQRVSTAEVLNLLEGLNGDSLMTTDLDRWRARLFASPWVADARFRRRLPATIDVEIRERQPAGIARIGYELHLIDAGATTIDEFGPRYADCDLPMIDGLVVDRSAVKPQVDRARSQLVMRLLADLRGHPDLAKRVSQIDVSDAHDAHVILDGDTAVVRLGDMKFAERLGSYVELQAALRERVPDIDYVDLRFGERVYVGPSHTAASRAPATNTTPPPARDAGARQQQ